MRTLALLSPLLIASLPVSAQSMQSMLAETRLSAGIFVQGGWHHSSNDDYALPGIDLSQQAHANEQGFQLMHAELGLIAEIDQVVSGKLVAGSHHGDDVMVEEAWLQPYFAQDWQLRVGRQLSDIGLYNHLHEHDWRFIDANLGQQAFFGGSYIDDSAQLKYAWHRHDMTAWVGRGRGYPASYDTSDASPAALGVTYRWHWFKQDHQVELVSSLSQFSATERGKADAAGHSHGNSTDAALIFNGDTQLFHVGAQWQWQNLGWEIEWARQTVEGDVTDPDQVRAELSSTNDALTNQWFWHCENLEVGLRYDWLKTANSLSHSSKTIAQTFDAQGHTPSRVSAVINWSFKPHQMLRFQATLDQTTVNNEHNFWIVYQGNLNW